MKKIISGSLVGGSIVFIWGMISWMVLPWHMNSLGQFKSELVVERMMAANATEKGIYVLPIYKGTNEEKRAQVHKRMAEGPFVFAAVSPDGGEAMPIPMFRGWVLNILAAAFMTWLLLKTSIKDYFGRIAFVKIVAFVGGIAGLMPLWNWWGFPMGFITLEVVDLLIGWGLAGIWLAKITAPQDQ